MSLSGAGQIEELEPLRWRTRSALCTRRPERSTSTLDAFRAVDCKGRDTGCGTNQSHGRPSP
jgi:hypothetical protein